MLQIRSSVRHFSWSEKLFIKRKTIGNVDQNQFRIWRYCLIRYFKEHMLANAARNNAIRNIPNCDIS